MRRRRSTSLTILATLACAWTMNRLDAADPLFANLPGGVVVERSLEVPAAQLDAIGRKLGGKIERAANSFLRVHGRPIQVNTLYASDEAGAMAIHAAIGKMKTHPSFCVWQGRLVVEYVGKDADAALAVQTSHALGLLPKRYRVTAEIATVDKADYMACNPLFNQFLARENGGSRSSPQAIAALAGQFQFGRTLVLRKPTQYARAANYQFQPAAIDSHERSATVAYLFPPLPSRHGVPFVKAILEISLDGTGFLPTTTKPLATLTAATSHWPAADADVIALARRIAQGKSTNDEKAAAILAWLAPGRNLKYDGPTGSRWGTTKAFEQKFGRCWDFSDCFVTLARAAGVPGRQVAGWLYGSGGHVWAEYYRDGKGWQQVDPTGGGRYHCGLQHIPYFTTEDGEMPFVYVGMPKIDCLP